MELIETSDIPPEALKSVQSFLYFVEISQTILVIGTGPNDLLDKFKKRGFNVAVVESDATRIKKWKAEGYEIIEGKFEDVGSLKLPKDIGGIWAGSAFEHMAQSDLEHTLEVLHLILPNKGALFLSVPKGQGELREGARVIQFYSEEDLRKVLEDHNYNIVNLDAHAPSIITAVVTR
ncbi:MAG: hypothetical protein J7501_02340 [Bdellovibrio sp.]|nr:hypothetical protein [Bdellovibrio sp.]